MCTAGRGDCGREGRGLRIAISGHEELGLHARGVRLRLWWSDGYEEAWGMTISRHRRRSVEEPAGGDQAKTPRPGVGKGGSARVSRQ